MKKVLFASTALAAMAIGGVASAEIALFGTARLGIGYGINNDGTTDLVLSDDGDRLESSDDFRAVSRIRFGVTMTGESDSGITFGATIRADNSNGGGTGATAVTGQTAGDVFVSGAWGTLTFGDTNGADEQHVGDAGGNYSLTGLGDLNETAYISNGGGFGDDRINFANNPEARPTVRYDYNFGGLGVSASTNRDLNDVGVGASYTAEFAGGSVTGGLGYYDFQEFTTRVVTIGEDGSEVDGTATVTGGEQYSVGLTGTFGGFSGGVVYSAAKTESRADEASGDLDILYLNAAYTMDAWTFGGYYSNILTGNGNLDLYDGKDAYGLGVAYDLGGGASVNFGVQKTYGRSADDDLGIVEIDDAYVGDFGISMAF